MLTPWVNSGTENKKTRPKAAIFGLSATEQIPYDRERDDQQHQHDHAAPDPAHG
jgi:hypothetical protein